MCLRVTERERKRERERERDAQAVYSTRSTATPELQGARRASLLRQNEGLDSALKVAEQGYLPREHLIESLRQADRRAPAEEKKVGKGHKTNQGRHTTNWDTHSPFLSQRGLAPEASPTRASPSPSL